jgi:hypothetical protein
MVQADELQIGIEDRCPRRASLRIRAATKTVADGVAPSPGLVAKREHHDPCSVGTWWSNYRCYSSVIHV